MKTTKKYTSKAKPSGELIVQKKLDDVNAMLKKMDLSQLINKPSPGRE
jgi:hypothetical protein